MLDFAIIGAPRSGTTALFKCLDAHPVLHGSTPKETCFFMDTGHPLAVRQKNRGKATVHTAGLSAFDQFFEESPDELRFEATTHHYYQETARKLFPQFDPKPHVFFLLRQPAHRIRSSFLFTKHNRGRVDSALTFNRYVDILLGGELSALDRYYHSGSSLYIAKRKLQLSQYVVWLKEWEECLGADHVHTIIFERFIENRHREIERICRILEVDPSFYEGRSLSPENETVLVRSPALQRLAYKIGTRIPDGWLKRGAKSLYRAMQVWGTTSAKAPDTDRGVEKLKEYFRPWNKALAQYSGFALPGWD